MWSSVPERWVHRSGCRRALLESRRQNVANYSAWEKNESVGVGEGRFQRLVTFFFDVFFISGTLTWRNAITLPYHIVSCKLTCRDGSR